MFDVARTSSKTGARRRPTMADVARLAGVSPTTVSFVINGRTDGSVGDDTAQRVRDAVARLDYRPNMAAQTLRTRRTRTIGFITDEIAVRPPAGDRIISYELRLIESGPTEAQEGAFSHVKGT